MIDRYKIVRYFQDDREAEIIVRGLSEAQAKEHCQRDDSRGPGWFDGYTKEWDG